MTRDPSQVGLQYGGVIGTGGMGVVMEGRQLHLGRTVAVKRLRSDRANGRNAQALLSEARITGAVAHPSVVPIHRVGVGDDGQPEIVLKRVDGRPWSHLLRNPRLVTQQFDVTDPLVLHISVLGQVCEAIHAAHQRNIVHRDLKPSNVMVGRLGEVYVLDWGLGVTIDPAADPRLPRATHRGAGTPQYMAPEMVSATLGDIGPWTDVYMLGGLLFSVLNGRPPHPGATSWKMVLDACDGDALVPDEGPSELVDLCRRCLTRSPVDRIQSAQSLGQALQDWLDHRPSVALTDQAEGSHRRLLEAIGDEPTDRTGAIDAILQSEFGAAVFAYQRALDTWAGNERARNGLVATVQLMVEDHLEAGRAGQAQVALSYLEDPPPALARRVAQRAHLQRWGLSEVTARWTVAAVCGLLLACLAWLLVGPAALALTPAPALLVWVASRADRRLTTSLSANLGPDRPL